MRVSHVIHRYPPAVGGSESYFARLGAHLAAHGDAVHVHTTDALDLDAFWNPRARRLDAGESRIDGVRVTRHRLRHIPVVHRYAMKAMSLLPIPAWQALTVPFNPVAPSMWSLREPVDLVHASAFPYSFPLVCATRYARRLKVPFILTPFVHTGDPDDPDDRIRRAYTTPALLGIARRADLIFTQTEGERLALVERGVDERRVVLQGLGVDLPSCTGGDRGRFRRVHDIPPAQVVVGHLGNNSPEKGTIDLLFAADRALAAGATFAVVVAGPQMPAFRAFMETYRPRGTLVVAGVLDDEGKRDFFAGIDAFALPSRSDSFGLVFPEAWANKVPCLGYRAGGVAWVIRDGRDGALVRCGDIEGLASTLTRWERSPEERRALGDEGRRRIDAGEFDWGRSLDVVRLACERLTRK